MSVTLVWRTDAHLSDRAPRYRVDDWQDTVLDKIRQVGVLARARDAQAVLDGGDLFHIKAPTKNSHRLTSKLAKIQSEYPCPTYACIGNHDVVHSDYTQIEGQPLGVLFNSGALNRLYNEHEAWIENEGVTVRVVGVPYHNTGSVPNKVTYDLERLQIEKGDEDYLVVVAHLLASLEGGTMFEGEDIVSYDFLKDLDADVTLFGHWHKNQGVREIAPGKWVVNIGSLSRGALTQDNRDRIPSSAVLTFTGKGLTIEEVPLKVKPVKEVFDLERRDREETKKVDVEAFALALERSRKSKEVPVEDKIKGLKVGTSIKEKALEFWELSS